LTGWPWPLNGVQEWFDNLYNQVSSAAWYAVNNLWNQIWAKLQWINNAINSAAGWIWNNVSTAMNWLYNSLQSLSAFLGQSITSIGTWIYNSLQSAGKWLYDSLQSAFNQLQAFSNSAVTWIINSLNTAGNIIVKFLQDGWNWVQSSVLGAINDLRSNLNVLGSNLQDTLTGGFNSLWQAASAGFNTLGVMVTNGIGGLWDSLTGLAGDLLSGVTEALGSGFHTFIEWVLSHLTYVGQQVLGVLTSFVNTVKDGFMAFINYCINGIIGALGKGSPPKEISEPVNVMTQALWDRQIKTIDAIYKSEPTELATTEAAMETLGVLIAGGIFALSTGTIADVIHPLKSLGLSAHAREIIYWLGIPSVTAAIAVMPTQLGLLLPLQYYLNYKWTPRIPDANDLVRFAVRECFIPAELERLLEPGPGEKYYSYMKMQGYSGEWANRFWGAHWVRPTIEHLNQYLYRHHDFDKEWEHEVKLNDYAPYAVKWLKDIIFSPYTRVDIRRMWDIGLVTEEEMLENYRWLGYDDKHAERMTLWSKAYTVAADIRALYSKGWIDESGARQMIEAAGVPKERADVFLQKLVKSGQADRVATEKDLTKTDILRLFKLGLISQSQAASMLTDLGYDAEEASYLTALYQGSQEITLKELTQAQILKAYRFGIYNRDEAKNKLIEEGWSSDAAETLLRLEDVNKAEAAVTKQYERDLSRSDIINAIQREIIDKQTGHDYLAYMGYSEWEIDLIFALEEIA